MPRKKTPEKRFTEAMLGPLSALGREILTESGASGVRVEVRFTCFKGKGGRIKLKMFVTPDAKNERVDAGPMQPRGTKLQVEAESVARQHLADGAELRLEGSGA